MKKIIKKFDVEYLQILDEKGRCDKKLMPNLSNDDIKKIYELMLFTRLFDEKLLNMQRQGRIGTYAPTRGQEACSVASAYCLGNKDFIFPSFRETGAYLALCLPAENILQYYAGDERGSKFPQTVNAMPLTIPVSTQTLHAVGFAIATKLKGKGAAVLTYFGDGATSEGDFHEAMNFAGVYKAPVVFICQNNQYAISTPREKQSASETLAQKAIAYGFKGMQVDGNDAFAVYKETAEAVKNAKAGKGPTLIECVTYRLADHTTADDATRYRSAKELGYWKKKDPIDRLRKYMVSIKIWDQKRDNELKKKVTQQIEGIVKKAESVQSPEVEDMFKYMYKEMPWFLEEQLDELKNSVKRNENESGDDG